MRGKHIILLVALGLVFGFALSFAAALETPLHKAVAAGDKDLVERLLAEGAEVNAKDNHNQTALHRAATFGNKELAELLLAKSAEVNAQDNNGKTPLDLAKTDELKALLRKYGAK